MATENREQTKRLPLLGTLMALLLLTVVPLLLMMPVNRGILLPNSPSCTPSNTPSNTYGPDDFVMENGFMTCLSAESTPGIDVSYYQGEIDWQQVREAGIDFAFVRLGFRRSADGTLGEDEMARKNLREAADAGLKVGAYFFSQALTAEQALEEARFALSILDGFPLDLPLSYDWETVEGRDRTDGMTQQALMDCVEAFCSEVEAAGYEAMVYFNRNLTQTLLDVEKLGDRLVWFAMYDTYPDAPCKFNYWQYTNKGTVPGIEGDVDLNLYLP